MKKIFILPIISLLLLLPFISSFGTLIPLDNRTNLSYVPYTGATGNVDLGNNNFTVNGTTFFVNSNLGRVGIETNNPSYNLDINGSFSANSYYTDNGNFRFNFYDDGSEFFWNLTSIGDAVNIETDNTKLVLYNTPSASNNWKVFQIFSKEASDVTEFVISKAKDELTAYFVRSLSIVGNGTAIPNPHNCSTFANYIDCKTDVTGPDFYVLDDVEINGSLYVASGKFNVTDAGNVQVVGNLTLGQKITFAFGEIIDNIVDGWIRITGNLNVTGNVTAENVFLPSFLLAHTNDTIPVTSAGVWHNVTFSEEESSPKLRITHTHNDNTNDTFTIVDDGYYNLHYAMSFSSDNPTPTSHVIMRVIKNGVELPGSLLEEDATKQYSDFTISNGPIVYLVAGDEIKFQFTSDDTDVSLISHRSYGVHHDTAVVKIIRIA